MSEAKRTAEIDGVRYSVEWVCAYRGKTDFVVRQCFSTARADVELSGDGEWGAVSGNIPESIVRDAIIAYKRAERADFEAWAARQDYQVDLSQWPAHPVLLSA